MFVIVAFDMFGDTVLIAYMWTAFHWNRLEVREEFLGRGVDPTQILHLNVQQRKENEYYPFTTNTICMCRPVRMTWKPDAS